MTPLTVLPTVVKLGASTLQYRHDRGFRQRQLPANGAAVGSAIGGGQGLIGGAHRGQDRADQQVNEQMGALALPSTEVRHDFTVSGYVFFPKGDYKQLQVLLVDNETGDTEVIDRPWK